MSDLPPPCDVLGNEIHVGETIAYPAGAGSDGSHIVVGTVAEIVDGHDRWKKPCRVLMVEITASSRSMANARRRVRVWMTKKTVRIG